MKKFDTLTDLANELTTRENKIKVFIDGEEITRGKPKISEIEARHESVENYLENLMQQNSTSAIAVQYGRSNGSSWADVKFAALELGADAKQVLPAAKPETDYIGMNGLAQPGESVDMLRTKNWMLKNEYDKIKADSAELKSNNVILKRNNEDLEKKLREKKFKIEDLKREHQKKLDEIEQPDILEKVLTNPQAQELLTKYIDSKTGAGLNSPGLDANAQKVVAEMQKSPNLGVIMATLLPHLKDIGFVNKVQKLIQPEGAQNLAV
jgi:hypothetical protein